MGSEGQGQGQGRKQGSGSGRELVHGIHEYVDKFTNSAKGLWNGAGGLDNDYEDDYEDEVNLCGPGQMASGRWKKRVEPLKSLEDVRDVYGLLSVSYGALAATRQHRLPRKGKEDRRQEGKEEKGRTRLATAWLNVQSSFIPLFFLCFYMSCIIFSPFHVVHHE